MKSIDTSLAYRSVRAAYGWTGRAVQDSVTGRSVARLASAAGPVFADSRFFGTRRINSSTLDDASLPVSMVALARPATAAQGALAGSSTGRVFRALTESARSSAFSSEWLRMVGSGLLGLGLGLFTARMAVSVLLILVGAGLALAGPTVLSALRAGDGSGSSPGLGLRRISGTTCVGMALCAVAGVVAGSLPAAEAKMVLAVVAAILAGVGLLYRPEGILLVVAAFPWLDWAARRSLGGLGPLWDDALLVISLALVAWSTLVLGRAKPRTVPIALPVLAMFAAAVGSIVIRGVPRDAGFYALRVLFEPVLFYFVGFLLPKNMRWVRWTIAVFLVACTGLALHGLYQYLTHAPMPAEWVDVTETSIVTRAYSVVTSPNVLGALLAMGGLLAGSLALSRALRGWGRLAAAGACLVQLAGLAVTFSRGAWLGLAAGLLALVVLAYRRYLPALVGVGIVAWFAAPRVFIDRLLFAFSSEYAERSATGLGRIYRWGVSMDHIVDHPLFGMGLGTFGGTTAYMFHYWSLWVDNFYLQMAAEGGLLLLLFFLWLLLRGIKGLVRGHLVSHDPYLKALTAGMFGAFVAMIVANIFEMDWETLAVGVEFWFLAGLVTSAALTLSAAAPGTVGEQAGAGPDAEATTRDDEGVR